MCLINDFQIHFLACRRGFVKVDLQEVITVGALLGEFLIGESI